MGSILPRICTGKGVLAAQRRFGAGGAFRWTSRIFGNVHMCL